MKPKADIQKQTRHLYSLGFDAGKKCACEAVLVLANKKHKTEQECLALILDYCCKTLRGNAHEEE